MTRPEALWWLEEYCKPLWMSEVQICRIRDKANCTNISLMKERGLPLLTKSIYYSAIFFYPHNCGIRVWYFCCSKFFFFSWTLCSVFWEEVKEIAYFIASLVQSYESTVVGQWALLTSFSALSFSPMYFCSLFVE